MRSGTPSKGLRMIQRILILAAGLCGAGGVALSAAAAHGGGGNTSTAASFLLMHAPVFLAIGLTGANRLLCGGGLTLLVGLLVFAGDLLMRDHSGVRLFPMAAPASGMLLIAGWLIVAVSAFGKISRTD
jgi:uncharacterized membrane protein YgdD (TMEM256/DUF423 family)